MRLLLAVVWVCVLAAGMGCHTARGGSRRVVNPADTLLPAQLAKLEPRLQFELQRDTGRVQQYEVILRTVDASAVVAAGIPLRTAAGPVLTGLLTQKEIYRAARLAAVIRISLPRTAHTNKN